MSKMETRQKSNSEVKTDTDKAFSQYQEQYPDEDFIADKITFVIKKLDSNKGYTKYSVEFLESYNVTLEIKIPEQLSLRLYDEGDRLYASLKDMGVEPFYSSAVGICDKENKIIGGISSNTFI